MKIVGEYTREAGVRQLEREIGRVMRHAAMQVAEGTQTQVRVDVVDYDAVWVPADHSGPIIAAPFDAHAFEE